MMPFFESVRPFDGASFLAAFSFVALLDIAGLVVLLSGFALVVWPVLIDALRAICASLVVALQRARRPGTVGRRRAAGSVDGAQTATLFPGGKSRRV